KPPKNYTHKDQDNWPLTFPICNSTQQSPINILSYGVESDPTMFLEFGPFYNTWLQRAELSNDGVTVEVELTGGGSPLVSGTAVNNELYRFQQFHFHWGSEDNVGSEHTIDNVRFPLEMHLVHYNDKYDNIIEAATKPDGLLVLAILFKLSVVNNPFLNPLIIDLGSVRCASRKLDFNNRVILAQLLPVNTRFFYQYRGSLTTPPCLETVNWIIFPETVPIGIQQMLQFRLLAADKDCRTVIGDNWRRTQATNSRVVKKPLRGIWFNTIILYHLKDSF
ncbi:carbonic anhydrase 9-like isoform X2, partial [Leptotrombidium deliense]